MYSDLIDAVSSIVNKYGISILSDPKFWNILSDSYSFGSNYTLKAKYKEYLSNGYISQILLKRGNAQKINKEIQLLLDKDFNIRHSNRNEAVAVLFSIAIAIGSSSKKDYLDYIGQNQGSSLPSQSGNPTPRNKAKLTWKDYGGLTLASLFGVIMSFGATIFYLAFFRGWWLFFVILLMGLAQVIYLACIMTNLEECRNRHYKTILRSIVLPFAGAILLNALMSFLFFSNNFRSWLGQHLHDFNSDGPTFITFVLCLIYVLTVGFGCISIMTSDLTDSHDRLLNRKIVIRTSVILSIGYILLFFYPNIVTSFYEYQINHEEKLIEEQYKQQIQTNIKLQKDRSKESRELSFKGVKLGISYETDIQTAEALSDFKDGEESYYSVKIDGKEGTFNLYSILEEHWEQPVATVIGGRMYSGKTSIDNHNVTINIYELDGLVPLIKIGYDMNETDFNNLVNLYTSKYGEPELMTPEGLPYKEDPVESYNRKKHPYYYSYSSYDYEKRVKNDYVWTYKNGTIRLSPNLILYISTNFITLVNEEKERLSKLIKYREQHIADSISKETRRQEMLRLQEEYIDSIRRSNNHQNAINEI